MKYLFPILCFIFVGCSTPYLNGKKSSILESKVAIQDRYISEQQKALANGTYEAIARITHKTKEAELALRLSTTLKDSFGSPSSKSKIKIDELLSEDKFVRDKAEKQLSAKEKDLSEALAKKDELQQKLDETNEKLIEYAKVKAIEENQSFWSKIKFYSSLVVTILVIAALLYFCPPILIFVVGVIKRLSNLFK